MASAKKKVNLYETEEGLLILEKLKRMALDMDFNTGSSYSSNVDKYPDSLIPFVDKHMNYLNAHPNIDPQQYIANLRLMSRVRV
jgi:hypothetical protein